MNRILTSVLCITAVSVTVFCSCSNSEISPENIKNQGDYFIDNIGMESGDLKIQVKSSSYYNNISDAYLKYSDLIEAKGWVDPKTGEMLDGSVFVLVDVNVQNENAIPEDIRYDDTTFRADGLQLVNIAKKVTSDNYQFYYLNYFSKANECSDNIFAYKLEKGSSVSFTLGYIADTDEVENLYLCTSSGNVNDTFVKLNFSN